MKIKLILGLIFLLPITSYAGSNIVDSFDYPIGAPNHAGYSDAQDFGTKNLQFGGKFHLGEDWNGNGGRDTDLGKPVFSIANGEILYSNTNENVWGGVMIVRHNLPGGELIYSFYGHLISMNKLSGFVNKGEIIGGMGKGQFNTMSAHLHFEIRTDSNPDKLKPGLGYSVKQKPDGWVDPSEFIDSHRQLITPPKAVTVSVTQKDYQSTSISWTKNESPYFYSYKLLRLISETDTDPFLVVELAGEATTEFNDSKLKQDTDYFYKVDVCNIANQCTPSQIVSTKTDKDPNYIGRVVYSSKIGNYFQIHLMDGLKENISRLKTSTSNDLNSKWSPDGKKILFDSTDAQTNDRQVFMMDKDGSNEVRITNLIYGAEQADWMPDGKRIVFRGWNKQAKGLFIQTIGQQDAKIITTADINPYEPSISNDGKLVFYNAGFTSGRNKGGLFVSEIETGLRTQLTFGNDYNVDVSPENSLIAYVSSKYSNNNLFSDICYSEIPSIMDKGAITEKDTSDSNLDPSFSNDGNKLIYSVRAKNAPDYELVIIDLNTGKQTALTHNDVDDVDADIFIE